MPSAQTDPLYVQTPRPGAALPRAWPPGNAPCSPQNELGASAPAGTTEQSLFLAANRDRLVNKQNQEFCGHFTAPRPPSVSSSSHQASLLLGLPGPQRPPTSRVSRGPRLPRQPPSQSAVWSPGRGDMPKGTFRVGTCPESPGRRASHAHGRLYSGPPSGSLGSQEGVCSDEGPRSRPVRSGGGLARTPQARAAGTQGP